MNVSPTGQVASLHLHPADPTQPMQSVAGFRVEAGQGIVGEPRYFGRLSRSSQPSRRQLSLIEREQIAEHAAALGLEVISPGAVRSNIETLGIELAQLLGRLVAVGGALVRFYEARKPCEKMDDICLGLRALMESDRQGMMAEIVQSGGIKVGDSIHLVQE